MTDAGPLVRIKQALTRLKQEVQQMEVRIGVVCLVTQHSYKQLELVVAWVKFGAREKAN